MKNLKINMKKGFSLVELLVVIAVIGVIAAIAIPAMSGIFGKADSAKTRRNAQNIVSVFNAARAAGSVAPCGDVAAAIGAVTTSPGITGSGTFLSSNFFVAMDPAEVTAATALIAPALIGNNPVAVPPSTLINTDGTLALLPQ